MTIPLRFPERAKPKRKRAEHVSFTDPYLRGLQPREKRFEVYDEGTRHERYPGFGLRVAPSGVKTFFIVYRRNGSWRRFTIGPFPETSLKAARARALDIRRDANDPAAEKKMLRSAPTFRELAGRFRTEYVNGGKVRPATAEGYHRHLRYLIDYFGPWKVSEIRREHVHRFRSARAAKAREHKRAHPLHPGAAGTNRSLEVLSCIFNWATNELPELSDALPPNPCAGLRALPEDPQGRDLKLEGLRAVLQVANELRPVWRDALWWLALYSCRPSDVHLRGKGRRGIRWEDLDLRSREWSLPTTKVDPRVVPLTATAIRVVKRAKAYRNGDLLFPVRWDDVGVAVREKAGLEFAPKDIRTTTATLMQQVKISPDLIDRIQGHRSFGGPRVRPRYQKYDYFDEQRAALERWHKQLLKIANEPRWKGSR